MPKKLLIILLIVVIGGGVAIGGIFAWQYWEKGKGIKRKIIDISDNFELRPYSSYSIEEHLVEKPEVLPPAPGHTYLQKMKIEIPCQNNFPKPLWQIGCTNDDIILEKKTIFGWKQVNETFCPNETNFRNRGMCDINYLLPLEEADRFYNVKKIDRRGTYRAKINFKYGCIATGKDEKGDIIYSNCRKATAYSPEFKIID